MNIRTIRGRTAAVAAAASGLLAVGLIVPAIAQESGDSDAAEDDAASDRERLVRGLFAHDQRFAEELAEELGLDAATVADAIEVVRERHRAEMAEQRRSSLEERLDEAVEDGSLTEDQADALLDAHDADVLPFGAPRGDRFGGPRDGGFGGHHGRLGDHYDRFGDHHGGSRGHGRFRDGHGPTWDDDPDPAA